MRLIGRHAFFLSIRCLLSKQSLDVATVGPRSAQKQYSALLKWRVTRRDGGGGGMTRDNPCVRGQPEGIN